MLDLAGETINGPFTEVGEAEHRLNCLVHLTGQVVAAARRKFGQVLAKEEVRIGVVSRADRLELGFELGVAPGKIRDYSSRRKIDDKEPQLRQHTFVGQELTGLEERVFIGDLVHERRDQMAWANSTS